MKCKLDYSLIGERIKYKRKSLELTQEKLADTAGIGIQHLSKIENGKATLSLPCLVSLANALNTTTDFLLTDNVVASRPILLDEVKHFFEDCSHDELFIIMRTATTLKESIRRRTRV